MLGLCETGARKIVFPSAPDAESAEIIAKQRIVAKRSQSGWKIVCCEPSV
jgi:hypothetical protein